MYSHLHPAIAPGGHLPIWGKYNPSKIVNMAKKGFIDGGFMKKRRKSESAEKERFELTALMSLEGALTPQILDAIAEYNMFGISDKKWLNLKQSTGVHKQSAPHQSIPHLPERDTSEEQQIIANRQQWQVSGEEKVEPVINDPLQTRIGELPEQLQTHIERFVQNPSAGLTQSSLIDPQTSLTQSSDIPQPGLTQSSLSGAAPTARQSIRQIPKKQKKTRFGAKPGLSQD